MIFASGPTKEEQYVGLRLESPSNDDMVKTTKRACLQLSIVVQYTVINFEVIRIVNFSLPPGSGIPREQTSVMNAGAFFKNWGRNSRTK
jgi:hypothetical protein